MLWLVHQLSEDYLGPHKYTYSFGVPLGHLKENYLLTRGQNHLGGSLGKEAPNSRYNHLGEIGMFHGDPYQHYPSGMAGSPTLQGSPNCTHYFPETW